MHFIYNVSFTSDHQVLDSGGWGPLSYTVPFIQKSNVARLFFPKCKPSLIIYDIIILYDIIPLLETLLRPAPLPLDSLGSQAASV